MKTVTIKRSRKKRSRKSTETGFHNCLQSNRKQLKVGRTAKKHSSVILLYRHMHAHTLIL